MTTTIPLPPDFSIGYVLTNDRFKRINNCTRLDIYQLIYDRNTLSNDLRVFYAGPVLEKLSAIMHDWNVLMDLATLIPDPDFQYYSSILVSKRAMTLLDPVYSAEATMNPMCFQKSCQALIDFIDPGINALKTILKQYFNKQ